MHSSLGKTETRRITLRKEESRNLIASATVSANKLSAKFSKNRLQRLYSHRQTMFSLRHRNDEQVVFSNAENAGVLSMCPPSTSTTYLHYSKKKLIVKKKPQNIEIYFTNIPDMVGWLCVAISPRTGIFPYGQAGWSGFNLVYPAYPCWVFSVVQV